MMLSHPTRYACLFFFVLSFFIYSRALGVKALEFRDDEIFYFKASQEMLHSGNFLSPTYFGENRFQKPILFYWLVIASYKLFGTSWASGRLVAVLFASLSVSLTWLMARKLFDEKIARLSALILMTIPLFFRHAKNIVPDMALNFFIVLAIYFFINFIRDPQRTKDLYLFFVSCALGFLVKGFAALIIPFGTAIIFILLTDRRNIVSLQKVSIGFLLFLLIALPWFGFMTYAHGHDYLNYMVVDETKGRLFGTRHFLITDFLLARILNVVFYLKVLLNYFSPWGVLFLLGLPLAPNFWKNDPNNREGLGIMMIWCLGGIIFFVSMRFVINHYLLVLTVPVSILTAYFCQHALSDQTIKSRIINFLRRAIVVLALFIGGGAYLFLVFFFLKYPSPWIFVLFPVYLLGLVFTFREKNHAKQIIVLSVFMIFFYAQSDLLSKAGITPHATLEAMAQPIRNDSRANIAVGVGSHDIHEKAWQVYLDQKIYKTGASSEDETRWHMGELFKQSKTVYCLMTEADYLNRSDLFPPAMSTVVKEDYLMRRRMKLLDAGFWAALIHFDQRQVYNYLMEKIVLVKREST